MFKDNKYTKIYNMICNRARAREIMGYVEKHHIIPRSLGGSNAKSNIVKLTAREHFICHLLLTKMCENKNHGYKMCWALHKLTFSTPKQRKIIYTSTQYELARKIHSKNMKENHPSKNNPEWCGNISNIVTEHWKGNIKRRKQTSKTIKNYWENNREKMLKIARENGDKSNCIGRNSPMSPNLNLEYNGQYYWSYKELKEKTGCSKHLYLKYYKQGIDPTPRMGKDGPVSKQKENR